MPIAALPMYDLIEIQAATDALWAAIATYLKQRNIDAPRALTRGQKLEKIWTDPDLLLGQSCGYPLVTSLAGKVQLLATPCYDAAGCEGALYRSALIVHNENPAASLSVLRGKICAINAPDSNSGMNLLRAEIAPLAHPGEKFFARVMVTGSHASSVEAVADGHADLAAIDCITWAHLQQKRPTATRETRVLGWTQSAPGLPYITSLHTDEQTRQVLIESLHHVIADPSLASVRATLGLENVLELSMPDYAPILALERNAAASGYPILR